MKAFLASWASLIYFVVGAVPIVYVIAVVATAKPKAPTQTNVYWLCNKDQIREMSVNQPNGMSAAIATHCELHTYERKM